MNESTNAALHEHLRAFRQARGGKYTDRQAFSLYEALKKDRRVEAPYAGAVLAIVLSHCQGSKRPDAANRESLARTLQEQCLLDPACAVPLAEIILDVFHPEQAVALQDSARREFEKFCADSWALEWKGWDRWEYGNAPSSAKACLTVRVKDRSGVMAIFRQLLEENSLLATENLRCHFEKAFSHFMDSQLHDWCNGDPYYHSRDGRLWLQREPGRLP